MTEAEFVENEKCEVNLGSKPAKSGCDYATFDRD
jgi:hypothetical protein